MFPTKRNLNFFHNSLEKLWISFSCSCGASKFSLSLSISSCSTSLEDKGSRRLCTVPLMFPSSPQDPSKFILQTDLSSRKSNLHIFIYIYILIYIHTPSHKIQFTTFDIRVKSNISFNMGYGRKSKEKTQVICQKLFIHCLLFVFVLGQVSIRDHLLILIHCVHILLDLSSTRTLYIAIECCYMRVFGAFRIITQVIFGKFRCKCNRHTLYGSYANDLPENIHSFGICKHPNSIETF